MPPRPIRYVPDDLECKYPRRLSFKAFLPQAWTAQELVMSVLVRFPRASKARSKTWPRSPVAVSARRSQRHQHGQPRTTLRHSSTSTPRSPTPPATTLHPGRRPPLPVCHRIQLRDLLERRSYAARWSVVRHRARARPEGYLRRPAPRPDRQPPGRPPLRAGRLIPGGECPLSTAVGSAGLRFNATRARSTGSSLL